MSTINEKVRLSDLLLFQEGEEVNYIVDQVTVITGTAASVQGQIMGQITIGSATETHAGNTGDGAFSLDASPVLANAQTGVYTVRCITAAGNSGTFRVFDPKGDALGDYVVGAAAFANQIKFTVADGTNDWIVGDKILVTVAAGSGKWGQVTPAGLDGTAQAAGILITPFTATLGADLTTALVIARGPAAVKSSAVGFTSGMTSGQKTTALAQLKALGIVVRADYGV